MQDAPKRTGADEILRRILVNPQRGEGFGNTRFARTLFEEAPSRSASSTLLKSGATTAFGRPLTLSERSSSFERRRAQPTIEVCRERGPNAAAEQTTARGFASP